MLKNCKKAALHYVEYDADKCRDDHAYTFNLVPWITNSLDGKTDKHSRHHPNDQNTDQSSNHFCIGQTAGNFKLSL